MSSSEQHLEKKKLSAVSTLLSDPETLKTLAACQTNRLAGLLHVPNQWFTKHHKVHRERRRQRGCVWFFVLYTCLLVCLCRAQKCVKLCEHVWEHQSAAFYQEMPDCGSVYVCVCVRMHDKEMDIYISSWLPFPGLSLMALCSGAELLLPTYFMTSCAPHATLWLLNNSTSPLSTLQRLPALPLSAYFFLSPHYRCLSFLCSLHCAEYVGQV